MKKLFSAKRYNSSSELRVIQKPTVRLRSVDDCRVEERRSSSPRACLAFSALSIWDWIGGLVKWISLDRCRSRLPEGAARLKRL
jgi:hypothetical protein